MPTQTFTTGNDTFLVHTAGTFDLDFLEGDDTLTVQGGDSTTAHMGIGNDVVQLKSGLATVFGDAGADRFEIYAANATVDAGDDNDLVNIRGGSGISASGGLGDDRFNIYAGSLSLTLHGGDGDDDFFGYFHPVTGTIYGDAGNDYFVEFVGGVAIYGSTGNDIYRADATDPAAFIELSGEGTDSVQVARGASYTLPDNIENLTVQGFHGSTTGAATLTGNASNNTINGHANVETIYGLGGSDNLFGKGGDDTVWGGEGNDYLDGGLGNDTLNGENGNDTINGRAGDDTMAGGSGDDTYYVDTLSDVITENAAEGMDTVRVSVSGYALASNVENGIVSSGVGGLTLNGNALDNILTGNSGNDTLDGWGGLDILKGGAGNDNFTGRSGSTLIGGTGNDYYYFSSTSDDIIVIENAGEGTDLIDEKLKTYTLPANVENGWVRFDGDFYQTLNGNELDNVLSAEFANGAYLYGLGGNDTLIAGQGVAFYYLYGGEGNDTLTCGPEHDYLTGGAGNDIFYFDNPTDSLVASEGETDQVQDFTSGTDKIDVHAIDANTDVAGDQAFTWVLFSTGVAGQWWFSADASTPNLYHLFFNFGGGDPGPDMQIDVLTTGGGIATTDIIG